MAHEGALLKGSGGPSTFAFRCRGGCMEWGRLERLIGLGAGGNTAEGRARCNYARSSERRLLPVEGRPSNARGATRTAVGPAGAAVRAAQDDCADDHKVRRCGLRAATRRVPTISGTISRVGGIGCEGA